MQGTWYGIGVGPGDPELMTLKAVRTIQKCEVIAIAVSDPTMQEPKLEQVDGASRCAQYLQKCVAYQIARQAIPEIEEKEILYLPMPMMKEKERLKQVHDECTRKTEEILDQGKAVAFITLGDVCVYSTCLYIHKRIKAAGYATELVPGITSFCAAAAKLNIGLVENQEELHVIPASYEIEESLEFPGTKVLMKAGRKMPRVKELIRKKQLQVKMVENCGMEQERIYEELEEIPDDASYYSLMILKERKQKEQQRRMNDQKGEAI